MEARLRILAVCDRGNVRSVAMANALRKDGHEAIPIGRFSVSEHTMDMLCRWADIIVIMEPHMRESIPETFHPKIWTVDVGPDVWGSQTHPGLKALVEEGAEFLTEMNAP